MKFRRSLNRFIIIALTIGIFFGVIMFFRYVGLKGLLGFAVGVLITGFVFMSNHPFIMVYREYFLK